MGKEEGGKLVDDINKDAPKYVNDSRKMVKELASLVVKKRANNMDLPELYLLVEQLQSQVKALQTKLDSKKWVHRGTLSDLESLVQQYPPTEYRYGVKYNHTLGCVHELIFNSWNCGIRVSTLHSYPMGDSAKSLKYGRTIFTKGLNDAADKSKWYQHYILENGDTYRSSNGEANSQIWIRPL